jgi:hypothetical protein
VPQQVSGLAAWYRADAIGGVADGAAVGSWVDSSGHGHPATAPSAAQQPTLVANAVNGLPAVRFDGTSDLVQAWFGLAQPATVLVVYDVRADTGGAQYVTDGAQNGSMVHYVTPGQFGEYAGGTQVLTRPGFSFGAYHVVAGVFAGPSSALYPDGGPGATGNPGTNNPGGITIGNSGAAAAPAAADVAEVVVYNRALTTAEIDQVGRYLAGRYGRPWTSP